MIDLTDVREVKKFKSNLELMFNTPQGEEAMEVLEEICGWYESVFSPMNKDMVLINAGKREVIATIKTIIKNSPEQIVALVQSKEGSDE